MKPTWAILIILLAGVLLFGCDGGGNPPAANQTTPGGNATNTTPEQPPVSIIVGPQENQSVTVNASKNNTETPIIPPGEVKELDYFNTPNDTLGVYFINAGSASEHGEAILIKKGDADILVDAGPADMGPKIADFLRSHGVDDIEVLVSTTADPRRYGGIPDVSSAFDIEQVWWIDDSFGDNRYATIMNNLAPKVKKVVRVERGFVKEINGITFEALNPPSGRFEDINNDAIVLKVTDRNFSMLLNSNIQSGAQGKMMLAYPDKIKAKVFDAPYYGTGMGTSNIRLFMINSAPQTIIISGSADDSASNGGSREPFIRIIEQYNATWYANYQNGTIRIVSDGKEYAVSTLGDVS